VPRRNPRQWCRVCEGHASEVGKISARGKCAACAERLILDWHRAIRSHSGPAFYHWRRQMAASVGGRLLDEWPSEQQTQRE